MNIGVRDMLQITFGNSKVRTIVITSEMMGVNLLATSINLDGRTYPVKIEKLSPLGKNTPDNSGR